MNALAPRSAFRFALFAFGLITGASNLHAQPTRFDVGYLDDPSYYRTTIQPGRGADYWFHLRAPGMTLRVNVQDMNGRGIEQATLFDAAGAVKAQSLGTIGASIGAANLASGWHHLLVTSRNSNHEIGVFLQPSHGSEPPDVGNDFGTAKDLGVVGAQGTLFGNRVGLGDGADFYRFTLATPSNHLEISLPKTRDQGAYLELYALNGSQARFVSRATSNGFDLPLLMEALPGGTYFARVTAPLAQATGPQATNYWIYLRSLPLGPDPAGNLQRPWMVASIPTRQPILESITPVLDPQDAYRFTVPSVGRPVPVRATIVGSSPEFAMYLLDGNQNIFANDTTFGARTKSITRTLAAGTYYVFVITQGYRGTPAVNYQLTLEANLPPTRPPQPPPPVPTRVSYGGFLYDNHTGTTTMAPSIVPSGGFFTITSTTMPFSGAGKTLFVILEVQNRRPGSSGVTRLRLTNVTVTGNTLTAQAPPYAVYAHQTYNVVVSTWTNGLPDDYANPGMLTIP